MKKQFPIDKELLFCIERVYRKLFEVNNSGDIRPFGLFRSGAVTLSRPLPLSGLFPFAGAITSKNTVMLHQNHINRQYRSEALLLRGNRTKNFGPKIFCTKTNE
ncbi:hypothetical protein HV170_05975 [Citrobacter freundii]|uniref:hypothetical protein n=1 Tax=Citrobacter freundii TaxID=546 RepID=UPI0015F4F8CD|nr:hypothetical protein [Citrobacter freundii]